MSEVAIAALGSRGDGLACLDGRQIYVAGGVPGDRLRVRLGKPRGDGIVAEIVEMLAPSPARVPAPCPHFGACGGCSLQHVDNASYAAWKIEQVRRALLRRGFAEPPLRPLVRIPAGTRRRISFAAERAAGALRVGFHARDSHRVVDATGCLIVTPALARLLPLLGARLDPVVADRGRLESTATETESGIDLLIRGTQSPSLAAREGLAALADAADLARVSWATECSPPEPVAIRRPVRITFGGVPVDLPPGAFLQPSAGGEAALVVAVTAALGGCRTVADLYAGCGTFAFPLAQDGRVHAVESDADAIGALASAARRAGLAARITTVQRDLAKDPLVEDELAPFDGVVFDPPRAGARAQAERLARSRVPAVVAVSCDPATFARDARILADGGYRLVAATPIDQFVWSAHVEVVALFRR